MEERQMEVTINYNGQAVAVGVTLEVYEFLDRADHKTENLYRGPAPPEFADRSILWNSVKQRQLRHNSAGIYLSKKRLTVNRPPSACVGTD